MKYKYLFLLFGAGLPMGAAPPAIVGTCLAGTPYATISAAVAAAKDGATIRICPGAYPEQVVIKKSLTLLGLSAGNSQNPVIQAPAIGVQVNASLLIDATPVAAQILVQNAARVAISNLAVDGKNNGLNTCGVDLHGIYFQNASGSLDHVAVRNQALAGGLTGCNSGEGIYIESGYGTSGIATVQVLNSSVHGYQKNGITADGSNTSVDVKNNYISGQGPTSGAAENGVQFSDGASGTIVNNNIVDHVYVNTSESAVQAGSGILIYSTQGVQITKNFIASSQLPIVTVTDARFASPRNPQGNSDFTTITSNQITNTNLGDGMDLCSNSNTVMSNMIFNVAGGGIHLDSGCGGTGINNTVSSNTIVEACAGILQGGTPNAIGSNVTFNVQSALAAGDSCVSTRADISSAHAAVWETLPEPLRPSRR